MTSAGRAYPWELYRLTKESREFLEEHNLLAAEETIQQVYDTISGKSQKIVNYENVPQPDVAKRVCGRYSYSPRNGSRALTVPVARVSPS